MIRSTFIDVSSPDAGTMVGRDNLGPAPRAGTVRPITARRLAEWYRGEIINRRTFLYLWDKHVYGSHGG